MTDPEDEPIPLTFRETLAAREDLRRQVDAARGRLIAATIVIEDHIGETILRHFDAAGMERCDDKVVADLSLHARLQRLKAIIQTCGLWGMYGDLWDRLDNLRQERNHAAHATYALAESGVPDSDNFVLSRSSKRSNDVTDLEELHSHAIAAGRIVQECIALDYFIDETRKRQLAEAEPGT